MTHLKNGRPPWIIRLPGTLLCTRCRTEAPRKEPMKFYAAHMACVVPSPVMGTVAPGPRPPEPLIDHGLTVAHNPHCGGAGLPTTGGFGRSRDGRRL